MDSQQQYFPDSGYVSPIRTKERCKHPAFSGKTNRNYHRVGLFTGKYHEEKLTGWEIERKCVNCGRSFGSFFRPGIRIDPTGNANKT